MSGYNIINSDSTVKPEDDETILYILAKPINKEGDNGATLLRILGPNTAVCFRVRCCN